MARIGAAFGSTLTINSLQLVDQSRALDGDWIGRGCAAGAVAVGILFTQAQATESANTLTIKPLAALVIETHTSPGRMKAVVEKHVGQFAQRSFRRNKHRAQAD